MNSGRGEHVVPLPHCVRSLFSTHCVGREYAPFLSAHFGMRGRWILFCPSLVCDEASVPVPVRVAKKNGGGFLFPSPSPVLVEPVPYLDDEAHEGDGEGDVHGDG